MHIHLIILIFAGYVLSEYGLLYGATPSLELTIKNITKKIVVFGLSITVLSIYWWSYSWIAMIVITSISYGFLTTARSLYAKKYPSKSFVREFTYLIAIISLIIFVAMIEDIGIDQNQFPLWLDRVYSSSIYYVIILYLSAFVLNIRGGTVLVRAMLEEAGKLPMTEKKLDNEEYNVGRWIGSLERTLILIFVLYQSYAAIGFILTAKSIARFNDLNKKEFAEYYLLGTLMSTLVAIVVGEVVNFLLFNYFFNQYSLSVSLF